MKYKPRKLTKQDFYFCINLLNDGVKIGHIAGHVYGISSNALRLRLRIYIKGDL